MDELNEDWLSFFPDLDEFEGQPLESASDEIKIEDIELFPESDGQRVVVGITVSTTRKRLNLELVILAPDGRVVAEMLLVESRSPRQLVTMHLRPPNPSLVYTVKAGLFEGNELVDVYETELVWPS